MGPSGQRRGPARITKADDLKPAVEPVTQNSPNPAGDAAGKNYWDSTWKHLPPVRHYEGPVFEQHPVFAKFLSQTGGGEAIEVGCVPGNFMVYLNKEFGYRVDGLDYSDDLNYVRANLEYNGIHDAELFAADLFKFAPPRKYDLVFSSGLVEHFDDQDLVVRKHAELAKSGGLVVIVVPNLTHIHRWLCGIFAPQILKVHRFPLMHKKILRETLQKTGLQVLHCEYHKTFRPVYPLPRSIDFLSRAAQKLLRISRLDKIGNRFGSPYLISVSVKQ